MKDFLTLTCGMPPESKFGSVEVEMSLNGVQTYLGRRIGEVMDPSSLRPPPPASIPKQLKWEKIN